MRRIILLVACLLFGGCSQAEGSRSGAETGRAEIITRERATLFPQAAHARLVVHDRGYDDDGQPVFSRPNGQRLTPAEREKLESSILVATAVRAAEDSDFYMRAACFIPHHFVRYYDEADRQIGEVEICFCCAGVQASDGPAAKLKDNQLLTADFGALASFMKSLGVPSDVECS